MSLDGSPVEGDCSCPVCVDLARRGIPAMTLGPDGEMVEVAARPLPPMIEVVVRGTLSTWPELAPERQTVEVPAGCVMQDLLEFLRYRDHDLQRGFPPGGLWGAIDREPCDDRQVVRPGDEVQVFGVRDDAWTALAEHMVPMPS